MGSKDDDYFVSRYEQGKREIIFVLNSPDDSAWIESFLRVAGEGDLTPVYYSGESRSLIPVAGQSNTLDNELRDDFYPARTKVLYFGEPKSGTDYEDHWALSNLAYVNTEDTVLV